MMNKEKIKALFLDDIEAITISKNDYDRLFGELTYENIELKQRIDKLQEENKKLRKENTEYQEEIFARDNNWYDMQD